MAFVGYVMSTRRSIALAEVLQWVLEDTDRTAGTPPMIHDILSVTRITCLWAVAADSSSSTRSES